MHRIEFDMPCDCALDDLLDDTARKTTKVLWCGSSASQRYPGELLVLTVTSGHRCRPVRTACQWSFGRRLMTHEGFDPAANQVPLVHRQVRQVECCSSIP